MCKAFRAAWHKVRALQVPTVTGRGQRSTTQTFGPSAIPLEILGENKGQTSGPSPEPTSRRLP